ncbi:Cytochrome b5 [Penicillium coprophilum]|uniref:Cytochrome b5 n=1 Tax=Penicillium coprophilum TaxID=36646 RepID=UPI0023A735E5|nr:Cytochrome b5 [Penicillium coprophilum]KAJ5164193.1 Cytochrome b5 [Penicillium coprophilum]
MSATKELTLQEVSEHSTKKDLYLILNDKIYDCTDFAKEHPGGEEVLLDLAGQDCTEAFDDVGHSDEARAILDDPKMFIGTVKRMPGDPVPKSKAPSSSDSSSSSSTAGFGVGLYAVILIGGAIAYGAYNYLQAQQAQQQ